MLLSLCRHLLRFPCCYHFETSLQLIERVVAEQRQVFLEETDSLEPCQLGFRLWHGTEIAMVNLQDDLLRKVDRGSIILIDSPGSFCDHGMLTMVSFWEGYQV